MTFEIALDTVILFMQQHMDHVEEGFDDEQVCGWLFRACSWRGGLGKVVHRSPRRGAVLARVPTAGRPMPRGAGGGETQALQQDFKALRKVVEAVDTRVARRHSSRLVLEPTPAEALETMTEFLQSVRTKGWRGLRWPLARGRNGPASATVGPGSSVPAIAVLASSRSSLEGGGRERTSLDGAREDAAATSKASGTSWHRFIGWLRHSG